MFLQPRKDRYGLKLWLTGAFIMALAIGAFFFSAWILVLVIGGIHGSVWAGMPAFGFGASCVITLALAVVKDLFSGNRRGS